MMELVQELHSENPMLSWVHRSKHSVCWADAHFINTSPDVGAVGGQIIVCYANFVTLLFFPAWGTGLQVTDDTLDCQIINSRTLKLPTVGATEQKVHTFQLTDHSRRGKSPAWDPRRAPFGENTEQWEISKVIINEETGIALTHTGLQNL